MQLGALEQLAVLLLAFLHLVALLASLFISALLDVLLKHLLPFLARQQQVARVEHDLVQLLFPRRERRHLFNKRDA